ncbi:MAG TPA: hypothetical protein VNP96_03685 [Solirubrobacterales bacterium]|nr:hypothetical protein [Solirubrobacterales bacterium]
MILRHRSNSFGKALAIVIAALCLSATSAAAAPVLSVGLSRDTVSISHSDERVDYVVNVANIAPLLSGAPGVGDKLLCVNPKNAWFREATTNYSFQFRWIRDGAPITAWESGKPAGNGDITVTHVVQAADAESAIQCLVKGTNGTGSGSFITSSQPMLATSPLPSVVPPVPNSTTGGTPRFTQISGTAKNAGEELTCTAPEDGWSDSDADSPITWSFQWVRNSEDRPGTPGSFPASGEVTETTNTTSKFKIATPELTSKAVFQCLATATNDGGATVIESPLVKTSSPAPAFVEQTVDGAPSGTGTPVPIVEGADNTIIDPVTLELELPGGIQTYVYRVKASNWTCDEIPASAANHAMARCVSQGIIGPETSLSPLTISAALGADAPDLAVARATAFGGGAAQPAIDEDVFAFDPIVSFGLTKFETGVFDCSGADYRQAGGHPCYGEANFEFEKKRRVFPDGTSEFNEYAPIGKVKENVTDLPRGFVGNPLAVPELCETAEEVVLGTCPIGSRVGGIEIRLSNGVGRLPIYAIKPEFGTPAQFAFIDPSRNFYTLTARLRPDDGYAASLELAPALETNLLLADVTLCNFGAESTGAQFEGCKESTDPSANPKPLFANPTRCGSPPPTVRTRFNSWEDPENWVEYAFSTPEIEGCEQVDFEPTMSLEPTSSEADSATGLDIDLTMPTEGLEKAIGCHEKQGDESSPPAPECVSQANMKKARITFPEGMAINASAGHGLGSCSADQVKLGTNDPISCPDSSKVGTIEIDTPLLRETLTGAAYIAKQGDVGGALIGLYLVFESKKDGIIVKVPGRVDPDPKTGRLVATVDESPEAPFSAVRMHFPGGPKATLLTPPSCGTKTIKAELFPWTGGAPVIQESSFEVASGPDGGPCPTNMLDPKLTAGTENPTAGQTSPFVMRLTRDDGTQRFSALNVHTPAGLTAYLRGIPYCSDAALASISPAPETGQSQIDDPTCPAASQIGTAIAGAGAGANPFYVETGRIYLAGPYKGAPLSIAAVIPAVAGPLDLGSVVVRNAVYVDPETARISVVSDPIPTILHGIKPDVRDIRVAIDRPGFILNPTSCEAKSVDVGVTGEDGGNAVVSRPFQAKGCENLSFGPKFSLRLFGGTKRGDHPKLQATLTAGPGEANIAKAAVTIPRSEFLDQAHIRTICTRVQFAAKACPEGSIYGHAEAITPLLDYPVSGPVYLRSSNNKLPDLVVDLHGPAYQPLEAIVVGRVDSIKGQIRATIEGAPDVPVTKFVLTQQGGKKGLLVNSRDICASTNRATIRFTAQNGMTRNFRPVVRNGRCGKGRRGKSKRSLHRRVERGRQGLRGPLR